MKVAALIALLEKQDPEARVYTTWTSEMDGDRFVDEIDAVRPATDGELCNAYFGVKPVPGSLIIE